MKGAITLSEPLEDEAEAVEWFAERNLVMVAIVSQCGKVVGVGVPPETAVKDLYQRACEAAKAAQALEWLAERDRRKAFQS